MPQAGIWADRNLMNFIKGKCKVLTWEAAIPCSSTYLGLSRWKATPQKRTLASWWTPSRTFANNTASCQRRSKSSWVALQVKGRCSFVSREHWWDYTWSSGSSSGLPHTRKTWIYWSQSSKEPQRWLRGWNITNRRGWETWDWSTCRCGDSGGIYQSVAGREGRRVTRLFTVVSVGSTRGNGHRLCLHTREYFFNVRVVKHWN